MEQIECKQGMLAKGIKPDDLPVKMWRGAKIFHDARKANMQKVSWLGRIEAVQPRIRLMRSFDDIIVNRQALGVLLRLGY